MKFCLKNEIVIAAQLSENLFDLAKMQLKLVDFSEFCRWIGEASVLSGNMDKSMWVFSYFNQKRPTGKTFN